MTEDAVDGRCGRNGKAPPAKLPGSLKQTEEEEEEEEEE